MFSALDAKALKKLKALAQEYTYGDLVKAMADMCGDDENEEYNVAQDEAVEEFIGRAASNNADMFALELAVLTKAAKALRKIEKEYME